MALRDLLITFFKESDVQKNSQGQFTSYKWLPAHTGLKQMDRFVWRIHQE